jgi:hypothetical protein
VHWVAAGSSGGQHQRAAAAGSSSGQQQRAAGSSSGLQQRGAAAGSDGDPQGCGLCDLCWAARAQVVTPAGWKGRAFNAQHLMGG